MGAKTLFEIVESTYSDVDPSFWIPAASNVRLHVEHLLHQDRLPKVIISTWCLLIGDASYIPDFIQMRKLWLVWEPFYIQILWIYKALGK